MGEAVVEEGKGGRKLEPPNGFEPLTCCLQNTRSLTLRVYR